MKIVVVSGAGGTFGDNMAYSVIEDWLHEFSISEVVLNPQSFPADAKGMIIGGCGIIYDDEVCLDGKDNPYRYQQYIRQAKEGNLSIIGLGLGWQGLPLGSGKDIWVENLNKMEFLTVWNKRTAEYLRGIGVTSEIIPTVDLAFSLEAKEVSIPEYNIALLTHPPSLIAKDCWKPEWKEYISTNLRNMCEMLSLKNSLKVISFCPFFNEELQFGKIDLLVIDNPKAMLGTIKKSKLCITTTLHALIASAIASKNILSLYPPEPLKPKIRWMTEELRVRGLPIYSWYLEILNAITLAQNDPIVNIDEERKLNEINKAKLKAWIEELK